ncbi:MAG: SURF1 family cytochrome oxidase biogenesis protein [Micromonosporaceae bacterium]
MSNSPSTPSTTTSAVTARYGFLRKPRWLVLIAIAVTLAAVMTGLGFWQLSRYHERTAINERIEAAGRAKPQPVTAVLGVSSTPSEDRAWARVKAVGRYDQKHEVLVRGRTVSGRVGYEVLTPLVLPDGSAVLVDRGWVPPGEGGAATPPKVAPAPEGRVEVVGRAHLPESGGERPMKHSGTLQARRVDPARFEAAMPYQLRHGYLISQQQTPASPGRFVTIPVRFEDSGQNASYVVQWWLFALIALVGPAYLIRREARHRASGD